MIPSKEQLLLSRIIGFGLLLTTPIYYLNIYINNMLSHFDNPNPLYYYFFFSTILFGVDLLLLSISLSKPNFSKKEYLKFVFVLIAALSEIIVFDQTRSLHRTPVSLYGLFAALLFSQLVSYCAISFFEAIKE